MGKIVKEFHGHSGSKVYLMEDKLGLYVQKNGNVKRNVERLRALDWLGHPVPRIYDYNDDCLKMQYIHGLDMKNYLVHNTTNELSDFIIRTLNRFKSDSETKDYTETYYKKLEWMDHQNDLPFTKEQLIQRLPKILPQTVYHGDMTLENIMYSRNEFYMIDPVTIEYDSYIFDIAKMRQDLECKWFLRNDNIKIDVKLKKIRDEIFNFCPEAFDNSLLILMLLRVYVHCERGDSNYIFIRSHINKLWK